MSAKKQVSNSATRKPCRYASSMSREERALFPTTESSFSSSSPLPLLPPLLPSKRRRDRTPPPDVGMIMLSKLVPSPLAKSSFESSAKLGADTFRLNVPKAPVKPSIAGPVSMDKSPVMAHVCTAVMSTCTGTPGGPPPPPPPPADAPALPEAAPETAPATAPATAVATAAATAPPMAAPCSAVIDNAPITSFAREDATSSLNTSSRLPAFETKSKESEDRLEGTTFSVMAPPATAVPLPMLGGRLATETLSIETIPFTAWYSMVPSSRK